MVIPLFRTLQLASTHGCFDTLASNPESVLLGTLRKQSFAPEAHAMLWISIGFKQRKLFVAGPDLCQKCH